MQRKLQTMLLITVEEVTILHAGQTSESKHGGYSHVLTDMTLVEFIAAYQHHFMFAKERYPLANLGGWFSIINVAEVGQPSAEEIRNLQSVAFSGYVWLKGQEGIPFAAFALASPEGGDGV